MSSGPIKVCHLTSAHPDHDVRILIKECKSLAKAGFEVSMIVPNSTSRVEDGVNVVSFQSDYKSRKERMTKTTKEVYQEALKLDADIYHFHDPELMIIANKLRKKGKKIVYDVHEDLPRQIMSKHWINKMVRKSMSVSIERLENHYAKKFDLIVAATPFIRDRFKKFHKNVVDINNFPILEELLLDFNYDDKKEDNICYVGGITRTRGILELLETMKYANGNLLLAGSFLEDGLRDEAIKSEGWSKVEELGFLDRDGVKKVYERTKVGMVTLHPIINYIDSLPVKMFEYMAAGLPVIASNFPYWENIVIKNKCGLCVDPMDPNATAEAINYILSHPEEAKQMGENGKQLVIEQYNWGIEEQKLINAYKELIK